MNTYEKLIFAIKKKMKERGVTQTMIAEMFGKTYITANRKFNRGTLSVSELIKICDLLGLEVTITEKKGNNE